MAKHAEGRIQKIGRNDSCPCGSGKKYKKCCIDKPQKIPDDFELVRKRMQGQHEQRQKQQGLGKPIISAEHNGYSFFDEAGYPSVRESRNPYSLNLHSETRQPAMPPSEAGVSMYFLNETVVSKIASKYFESRDSLSLRDVIWNIWTAKLMPVGLNLVAYAAAFEALMKAWFRSSQSKSAGLYMPKQEFDKALESALQNLSQFHTIHENWPKVLWKIKSSNQAGISESYFRFLDELGLKYGEVERQAFRERNKYAHGGTPDEEDLRKIVRIARAYETLINRAILKAIGYDGTYRDYSTLGFPERALEEALGGHNGDGRAL